MSKAEEYADKVLRENYFDGDDDLDPEDQDLPLEDQIDMDDQVEGMVRYRDIKAWLVQGFEAGRQAALEDWRADRDGCCDECGAIVQIDHVTHQITVLHDESCSLHPANIV